MKHRGIMNRAFVLLLALVLVLALFPASMLAAPALPAWPTDWTPETRVGMQFDPETGAPIFRAEWERNVWELYTLFGQRLAATPNEYNTARYIAAELEAAGVPADTIEHHRVTGRPTSGFSRLVFAGDLPDIYGNASPNNDTWANAVTGATLVDFGALPALAVPAGTTGNVVALVRVAGAAPNINNINAALNELETANPGLNIVGVLTGRTDTVIASAFAAAGVGGVATPARPFASTNRHALELAAARAGSFEYMERYVRTTDNAVTATIPAATSAPDMIIVLSAHMDSVIHGAGVSDNASGTVGLLELARRLADNTSNIEFRLLAIGSHEEARRSTGAQIMVDRLVEEGNAPIAIHLDMDMIASADHGRAGPITNLTMDIYIPGQSEWVPNDDVLIFNLPAYLVVSNAPALWNPGEAGIYNVRGYNFGAGDHQFFTRAGMDAARMIMTCTCCNYLGVHYHRSGDNLEENYCFYRWSLAIEMMAHGVQRAIEQEITKRAHFRVLEDMGALVLVNTDQLWQTFSRVTGTITLDGAEVPFTIEYPGNSAHLSEIVVGVDYSFSNITAFGRGIIDHAVPARAARFPYFQTGLVASEFGIVAFLADENGTIADNIPMLTVSSGGQLQAHHIPTPIPNEPTRYAFSHWISTQHEGKFTCEELLTLTITEDTAFTAVFDTFTIEITNPPVVLRRNTSVRLDAAVVPAAAPQELIWTSSNPALATVSADGVVTARVSSGVVVITTRTATGQAVTSVTLRLSM